MANLEVLERSRANMKFFNCQVPAGRFGAGTGQLMHIRPGSCAEADGSASANDGLRNSKLPLLQMAS